MRSSPNNSLARRDTAIADLSLVLSDEAFTDSLRRAAPWLELQHASSVYARYKPGTSCLAGFQLTTASGAGYCHVNAFAEPSRAKLAARLQRGVEHTAQRSQPLAVALGACAVVTFFPLDHRVRALWRLWDDRERQQMFATLQRDLSDARLVSIAYKPERRYVARLTSAGHSDLALKAYTSAAFTRVRELNRLVTKLRLARTPQLKFECERHAVAAWSWEHGSPLSLLLEADDVTSAQMQSVGSALATLHNVRPMDLPAHSPDKPVALDGLAKWLTWIEPSFQQPIDRILAGLRDCVDAPQAHLTLQHGDFYAKQVLLDNGEPVLLDFDCAGLGDPLADVGNFIAHLECDAVRGRISRNVADSAAVSFLRGYSDEHDVSAPALSQHIAKALLRLAPGPFRQRTHDWIAQTHLLLGAAWRHLSSAKAALVEVL